MRLLRFSSLSVFAVAFLSASIVIAQQGTLAVRVVSPIDEHQLITLKGTVHALANAKNDRGAAPDDTQLDRIHLVLKRSASQETSLQKLISDMHTPGTASYHKWLTPDEFGKQFGPADQDIATVETWLTQHGFAVSKVLPGKQVIEFSGNAGQFRTAFHAQIHKYQVEGQVHLANASDPQIPAALAPVVGGFASLNNFHLKSYVKTLGKAQYDPKLDHAVPEWTIGTPGSVNFVLAPQDYAVQYDLNPLYTAGTNGSGQTIAIINESNINVARVNSFRSLFGLSANPPQVIIDGNDPGVDGVNNPDGPNYASVEAYLDVEWSGAVAPGATVDLVIGGDTALESGLVLAAERAVYSNIAPVMSLSFGQCEGGALSSADSFFNQLWEQAAAQGITVLVSTGDNGSAGCDNDNTEEYASDGQNVNALASTPYSVGVGGTDFYYSDFSQGLSAMGQQMNTYWNPTPSNNTPGVSIKGVIPEQPWNDSQYGLTIATLQQGSGGDLQYGSSIAAGSGGSSKNYTTKPVWQTGFGDSVRDLPDVSLFASNGVNASFYPICAEDGDCQPVSNGETVQIYGVGGTSASSPSFAGIMALVNQKYGRQGQADFVLYPLSKQVPAAFNDVKNGTNTVPCDFTDSSTNCIAVSNPGIVQVTDASGNKVDITEGEIGSGTTAWYNAGTGYDEASGLGTIDANQLVTNWGKVKFTATTTILTPSSTSFTHGTGVTISGSVTGASGTPTGDVALLTDNAQGGSPAQAAGGGEVFESPYFFTLNSGAFSNGVTTLPGGTYNIWGQYGGDSTYAESTSTPVSVTVTPESSGVFFQTYSPTGVIGYQGQPITGTIPYGTQLSMSAQVVPGSLLATLEASEGGSIEATTYEKPTGTVAFADNGKPLNTAVLNVEGDAEYSAPYAIGSHSVTASYAGNSSYNASSAAAITFTIGQDTPNIYLGASNLVSTNLVFEVVGGTGQPTILNILVENGAQSNAASSAGIYPVPVAAPTGSITVTGLPSGVPTSATLHAGVDPSTGAVAGIGTIALPASTPTGYYGVSLTYGGDSNYAAVPTETGDVEIVSSGQQTSTTTATSSGSVSPTTNIVITGTVTGSGSTAPTGTVYIYSSGSYIASSSISPGSSDASSFTIVLNSQNLSQGSNFITVQYFGDTTYGPSAYQLPNPVSNPLSDFTLIASSANVPIAVAGDSGTVQVTATSMRGFTGPITLTTRANSSVGIQIPSSVTLTANGSQSFNVVLTPGASLGKGTFPVEIIGTDSTGKYVHTIGIFAVVATASSSGFKVSSGATLTIPVGATTGNTIPITITPSGGFTGVVDLSCSVASVAGVTSPVTCSIPASADITGTGAVDTTLTVDSTFTTSLGNNLYSISVTGKDAATGKITSTGVEDVSVMGLTPTVKITPSATTVSTSQSFQIAVIVSGAGPAPVGMISLSGPFSAVVPSDATLVNGAYTYNIPAGAAARGTDTVTVDYEGGGIYSPAQASSTIIVNGLSATLTEVPSAATIVSNQTLTVSGTVSGTSGTPSGTVTLSGGGYTSATTTISAAGAYSITIPINSLSAGTDKLSIQYSGDTVYNPGSDSTTVVVTQFVGATPTVTVTPASTTLTTEDSLGITGKVTGSGGTPTGSVIITAGTYTSGSITLTSGSFTGTIPAGSLSIGTDTITAAYSGDTVFATGKGTATVTVTQFIPPTPTVTVTPASTSVDTGSTLGVSGTVAGSGATPSGSVVITAGSYTSPGINLSAGAYSGSIPAGSLTAGTDTITVTYSGNQYYATAKGTASVTVNPSVFTVTTTSPTGSISPGFSASSTVTVASTTGYAGTVTLTCVLATSPTGATDLPTCTVPSNINFTLSAGDENESATLSITTTAPSSISSVRPNSSGKGWTGAGGGAVLALLLFFGIPAKRRSWRAMLGMIMLMAALGSLAACGGGGGGGGGTSTPGTTAGTYTFTVTGTGSPATASAPTTTFTVTVN